MGLLVMWATKNEQPVFTFLFFGLSLVIGVGGFRWLALRKHRFALIWGIVWLLLLLSLAVLGVLIGTSPMGVV
ncbi:MAG: hypothetical protein GYA57_10385 [Myxococcales bacterium]|nr:hypothetical protein [Myxococcales bacterium]